jgi:hypothetical protein
MGSGSAPITSSGLPARLASLSCCSGVAKIEVLWPNAGSVAARVQHFDLRRDRAVSKLERDAVCRTRREIDVEHAVTVAVETANPQPAIAPGDDKLPEALLQSRHACQDTATAGMVTTRSTPLVVSWWSNP